MASNDVVFETGSLKGDSFSAQDTYDSVSASQGVAVEFSFGSGSATLNGASVQVLDATIKLKQNLSGSPVPSKVEPDSPFDAAKSYKIQIVEV